ncbi:acyl carrier protein [Chengkuizengella marina]|uniref:Acyl carrier protein n=1 Tax=Chengkuizengella marina TaxID=2507566 RepID=A0A6N9Q4S0_9BACL|nr:acyl carrier protein [Chengkuizengella marina]NBI29828.1 acyl carrier protein [Chengkuizengella marina]
MEQSKYDYNLSEAEVSIIVKKNIIKILKTKENIENTDYLAEYGFDSIEMIELIIDLEEKFHILFDDEELLPENFQTINQITRLCMEKLESFTH